MLHPRRALAPCQLRDVWISGNEAVVTDDACGVYLPHHGVQALLTLALAPATTLTLSLTLALALALALTLALALALSLVCP